jgi:hypothetical protein
MCIYTKKVAASVLTHSSVKVCVCVCAETVCVCVYAKCVHVDECVCNIARASCMAWLVMQ